MSDRTTSFALNHSTSKQKFSFSKADRFNKALVRANTDLGSYAVKDEWVTEKRRIANLPRASRFGYYADEQIKATRRHMPS